MVQSLSLAFYRSVSPLCASSEMQAPGSVNLQQALDEAWGIAPSFLRFGGETHWWIINKNRKTVAIKTTRAQAFAEAAAHNEALGVNVVFVCGVAGKTGQWEYTDGNGKPR